MAPLAESGSLDHTHVSNVASLDTEGMAETPNRVDGLPGRLIPYPHKTAGGEPDPLFGVFAYHEVLKVIVCIKCHQAIPKESVGGHVRDIHRKDYSKNEAKKHAQRYASTLDLDDAHALRMVVGPDIIVPAFEWLKDPTRGVQCNICKEQCYTESSPTEAGKSMAKHINEHKRANSGAPWVNQSYNSLVTRCWIQHLGYGSKFGQLFPVLPPSTTTTSEGTRFSDFLASLPTDFGLAHSLSKDDATSAPNSDLPPFLAKVQWSSAVKDYSPRAMRQAVSNPSPSKGDPLSALDPLGNLLFTKGAAAGISAPPEILEGLTVYRTRPKPFQVLTEHASRIGYGREAVRLVSMMCRRRAQGDNSGRRTEHENEDTEGDGQAEGHGGDGDDEMQMENRESSDTGSHMEDCDDGSRTDNLLDEYGLAENGGSDEDHDQDGDEAEDGSDNESEYDDDVAEAGDMDDWEDGFKAEAMRDAADDAADAAVQDDEDTEYEEISDDPGFYIIFSRKQEKAVDSLLKLLQGNSSDERRLMEAFADVLFATFTSHPEGVEKDYFHTPVEAFLIARGLSKDGGFMSSHNMSSTFSRVQYAGLFAILHVCLRETKPIRAFNRIKQWVNPNRGTSTAFSTIRRYHRLAYHDSRNFVAPPIIQFFERYGSDFTYKGAPLSVDKLAEIPHKAFEQAKTLLRQKIMFGLDDAFLGSVPMDVHPDDTSNMTPGYGRLATTRDSEWTLMRHILDDNTQFRRFFDSVNGVRIPKQKEIISWLRHIELFKENIFILLHWLAGMPKRGTEIVRLKIANIRNRARNFYQMYGYMAIIGLYNKTSANTGRDNVTLHFIPHSISRLISRFYYSVANVERWFVAELYGKDVESNWDAYFFSSRGRVWKSQDLSRNLRERCLATVKVPLGLQPFRHIMPAIATHYRLGQQSSDGISILHDQMGHGIDTGDRLYGRTTDGHHHLTNTFCHASLDFCIDIHKLWGFATEMPSILESYSFRQSIVDRISGRSSEHLQVDMTAIGANVSAMQMQISSLQAQISALLHAVRAYPTNMFHIPPVQDTNSNQRVSRQNIGHEFSLAPVEMAEPIIIVSDANPSREDMPANQLRPRTRRTIKQNKSRRNIILSDDEQDGGTDPDIEEMTINFGLLSSPSKSNRKTRDVPSPSLDGRSDIDVFGDPIVKDADSMTQGIEVDVFGGPTVEYLDSVSGMGEGVTPSMSSMQLKNDGISGPSSAYLVAMKRKATIDLESVERAPPRKVPRLCIAKCPECGIEVHSQKEIILHFGQNAPPGTSHAKSVSGNISLGKGKRGKFNLRYFRDQDMKFRCDCCPHIALDTKSAVEEHIQLVDRADDAKAHIDRYCKNRVRPEWITKKPEDFADT